MWKVEDGGKPSRTTVNVGFYDQPNAAPESDCPTGCLDAADARLLDSVFYAGDIWTTHATAASATVGRSVVRIYGVDAKTGAVTTRTYGATGISCFDPSLSIRPSTGFGALVYTRSSPTQNPVIKVAARINGVWQAAVTAKASSAPYHGNKARHRWGDFAGASPDLGGDRVWTFSEYATGTKTWATWIARVDG